MSNSIVDATGTEKICVNEEFARKMFVSATKGTNAKFVETDSITCEVVVLDMAGNTHATPPMDHQNRAASESASGTSSNVTRIYGPYTHSWQGWW